MGLKSLLGPAFGIGMGNWIQSGSAPVGSGCQWFGSLDQLPAGWMECDGRSLNRQEYAQLFNVIGTGFGAPDGDTFNLPDLRGMFLRGVSGDSEEDPDKTSRGSLSPGGNTGNAVGSFQDQEFESHDHTMEQSGIHEHALMGRGLRRNGGGFSNSVRLLDVRRLTSFSGGVTSDDGNHTHTIDPTGGSETRPKNVYVYFMIKVQE